MKNSSLLLHNSIHSKYLKINNLKHYSKKFEKVFKEVKSNIKNSQKTLNVLNHKYKFNFKLKDLKRFKKFKKIAIIGMGGSRSKPHMIF